MAYIRVPEKWLMHYGDLSFWAKLTPFKHTGVFPEQSIEWDWIHKKIMRRRQLHILDLFAYTGMHHLLRQGRSQSHTRGCIATCSSWAHENQVVSDLHDAHIR